MASSSGLNSEKDKNTTGRVWPEQVKGVWRRFWDIIVSLIFLGLVVFLGSEKQFLVKEKINLNYYTVDFIFGGKCLKGKIEREVWKRGRGGWSWCFGGLAEEILASLDSPGDKHHLFSPSLRPKLKILWTYQLFVKKVGKNAKFWHFAIPFVQNYLCALLIFGRSL